MRASLAFAHAKTVHDCTFPLVGIVAGKPVAAPCTVCGEDPPTYPSSSTTVDEDPSVASDLVLTIALALAR